MHFRYSPQALLTPSSISSVRFLSFSVMIPIGNDDSNKELIIISHTRPFQIPTAIRYSPSIRSGDVICGMTRLADPQHEFLCFNRDSPSSIENIPTDQAIPNVVSPLLRSSNVFQLRLHWRPGHSLLGRPRNDPPIPPLQSRTFHFPKPAPQHHTRIPRNRHPTPNNGSRNRHSEFSL
jgi:hypothetical protein